MLCFLAPVSPYQIYCPGTRHILFLSSAQLQYALHQYEPQELNTALNEKKLILLQELYLGQDNYIILFSDNFDKQCHVVERNK